MKNMENEDLCMAIFRRLSRIGFDINNPRGEYAILQFIMKYVLSFLSNEQLKNGEYDVETTKKSIKIIIDTPDTKEINVRLLDSKTDSLEKGIEISTDNYENGSLKIFSNDVLNEITCEYHILDTTESYIMNTCNDNEKFTYSYALNYGDREEMLFAGELSAIGTTIKNKEYFSYERLYPEANHNLGVLNNIRRYFSPAVIKCIPKHNIDANIFDDVFLVFDVLKSERNRVLSLNHKEEKKLAKKTE